MTEVLSGRRRFCLDDEGSVWTTDIFPERRFCLDDEGFAWTMDILIHYKTHCKTTLVHPATASDDL
jgi:hypothetical protein